MIVSSFGIGAWTGRSKGPLTVKDGRMDGACRSVPAKQGRCRRTTIETAHYVCVLATKSVARCMVRFLALSMGRYLCSAWATMQVNVQYTMLQCNTAVGKTTTAL